MFVLEVGGIPSVEAAADLLRRYADQIDFAISFALNLTAEDIAEYEREEVLPARFKIRRAWAARGTRFGINVKGSTKKNLEARVFTKAPWMRLQEYGGTKRSPKGDVLLLERNLRQDTERLIPRKIQPSKVLAAPGRFRAFKIGQDIWRRYGKADSQIEPLYFGKSQTRIPQRFGFRHSGIERAQRTYKHNFGKALAFAIATAKQKSAGPS